MVRVRRRFGRRRSFRRGFARRRSFKRSRRSFRRYRRGRGYRRMYRRRFRRTRRLVRSGGRLKYGYTASVPNPVKRSQKKLFTIKAPLRLSGVLDLDSTSTEYQWYIFTNTIGVITLPDVAAVIERPDTFPSTGFSGTLYTFSFDAYLRAVLQMFFGYRNSINANVLSATAYGNKGIHHPSEINLRRLLIDYNRVNLYKITIRFKRRVGRSTNNNTILPAFSVPQTTTTGTPTDAAWTAVNPSYTMVPTASGSLTVPNTGGELPWFSQVLDYHSNGWYVKEQLRNGFSGKVADPILGTSVSSITARVARMLTEMNTTTGEWTRHGGGNSISLSLRKRKRSGDFLRIIDGNTTIQNLRLNASYITSEQSTGQMLGVNSVETTTVNITESAVSGPGSSTNYATLPAIDGPRGSVLIWCPYDLTMMNSLYDVEVIGKYRFSQPGKSSFDLPISSDFNMQ